MVGWPVNILGPYLASDTSRAERGRGVTTNIFEPPLIIYLLGAVACAVVGVYSPPSLTFEGEDTAARTKRRVSGSVS